MSGFMDMSKFLNDDYGISLADTYKGGISLTETMNRSIGREISARLQFLRVISNGILELFHLDTG